jgi:predicted metalloprotease
MATFVAKVLGSTETTWQTVFSEAGRRYQEPKLVLFTGATPTACGTGKSAMGPFYCPADQKVYIDLAFYRDLRERFHAPGEFAQAYVIAHEVGHHVQNLLGISDKVHAAQQRSGNKAAANALSVRLELQADCFAGVWGHRADSMQKILEPGETEQALTPLRRSATTACSGRRRARSSPSRSPTALPNNAYAGSSGAWRAATSGSATRSMRRRC